MTVQFSKELLETFFAPGIDELRFEEIRDLGSEIPKRQWLWNHFLNSAFGDRWNALWRARFVTMAFRTQAALSAYDRAKEACDSFVARSIPGHPALKFYFEAIAQFEAVIHHLDQLSDIFEQTNGQDHSRDFAEVKVRDICNRIKHVAEDFEQPKHSGLTIPMWLTTTGLKTSKSELTFSLLAEMLIEIVQVIEDMQNPSEWIANHRP